MKNARKISVALMLVAVILTFAVVAVVANDTYTGNIVKLTSLVDKAVMEEDMVEKEVKLTAVGDYLEKSPVDPESEGYDEIIELYETTILDLVNFCFGEAEKDETTAADKDKYIQKASQWIDVVYDTDEEKEGSEYKALMARIYDANLASAKALYAAVDTEGLNSTDTNTYITAVATVKALHAFTSTHLFDESSTEASEIVEASDGLFADYEAAKEARRLDLLWQAKLSEYGLGIAYETHFNGAEKTPAVANNTGGYDADGKVAANRVLREEEIIGYDEEGKPIINTYYTLHMDGIKNASGKYLQPYFNPTYSGATAGMVFEFDITAFDALPSSGIGFQPYAGSSWMNISSKGTLTGYNKDSDDNVVVPNAVVVGEWTHITYVYNYTQKDKCMLFVDYVFAGYVHGDTGNKGTTPAALRMGNTGSSSGSISIDNMVFTVGTAPRQENYFASMTGDKKFLYYVEYMSYTNGEKIMIGIPDCILAYEYATDLITNYVEFDDNGDVVRNDDGSIQYKAFGANLTEAEKNEVKAAVEAYLAFDPTDVIDIYSRDNLVKLEELAKSLESAVNTMAPTSDKITTLTNRLSTIETFAANYANYIHDDSGKNDNADGVTPPTDRPLFDGTVYAYCQDVISRATDRLANDTKIYKYILAMNAFEASMSTSTLEKKLAEAEAILAEGIPINSYYDENGNVLPGYENFDKHYYITRIGAPAKIKLAKEQANSKSVISLIDYICDKYPREADWKLVYVPGDNLTPEQEANNATYKYIADYLSVIRSYLLAGDYDRDYTNSDGVSLEYALERYAAMNEYYYGILQSEHAETLAAYLDQCSASVSYIEKKGLLAHIRRYISGNEVDITVQYTCPECGKDEAHGVSLVTPACPLCGADVTIDGIYTERESLKDLVMRYIAYDNELEAQQETYEELLNQNTSYFIDLVQMLDTAITYAEKKAYYDAATVYYDIMNVGGEDAQAAILIYNKVTAELAVYEDASREFIKYTALLETTDDEDVYFIYLVKAATAQKSYDTSIEGVEEALVKYNAARAAYDNKVDTANNELSESCHSLGSLTKNCGLSSIISVIIEKLFTFN